MRNKNAGYSIEKVFKDFFDYSDEEICFSRLELPSERAGLKDIARNLLFVFKLKGYDVYHVTGDAHYVILGLVGKKSILTVHDTVLLDRCRHPVKKAFYYIFWFLLPFLFATRITAISSFTQDCILRRLRFRRISVVPNSVGCIHFPVSAPMQGNGPFRVLQIGTGWNKNLGRVIEGLHGLDCELTILGPLGEDQSRILESSGVQARIRMGLDDREVAAEYDRCQVVVFVSIFEGFGMPIIEAQAHRRPVITSAIEPMQTIAGDGALLVDPYSSNALRDAISKVMRDENLMLRLVEQGDLNVKKYSFEAVLGSYKSIYSKLS